MAKINLRNIVLIGFVTCMDIVVGVWDRLVPSRGIVYDLQTSVFSFGGPVSPGFTSLNATNQMPFIMEKTWSSSNAIAGTVMIAVIAVIGGLFVYSLMGLGGRR